VVGPVLATTSLELRPSSRGDIDALHDLWTRPEVRRFLFDDRTLSREEAAEFVARSEWTFQNEGYGIWIFLEKGDGRPGGFAGLLRAAEAEASLLYGTRPDLWGRGYASEAASAVLAYAFGTLGIRKVRADVDEPNLASVRVLEKLGMERIGRRIEKGRPLLDYEIQRRLE
jgi:RimJ/RimL family protein N-acetyltransferase